jgi:hypothetical protein
VRPALPRELENVAKARRGEHPRRRPFAFEDRVRRERGAEHDEFHVFTCKRVVFEQLHKSAQDTRRGIRSERRHLVIVIAAAREIHCDEIGERAAGVDADVDRGHGLKLRAFEGVHRF